MNKRNLSQQTADTLYEMVADGILPPGAQLPNEHELAARLNISRTTLREAIHILAAQGVLTIRRGRGTFVTADIPSGDHFNFGGLAPAGSRLQDLLEARLLFEPGLAAMACHRASDQEIARILSLGAAVEEAVRSGQSRMEADWAFHQAIIAASHNTFLTRLLPAINQASTESSRMRSAEEMLTADTLEDHALLMKFLQLRNAHGARQAMDIHIRRTMLHMNLLDEGASWGYSQ